MIERHILQGVFVGIGADSHIDIVLLGLSTARIFSIFFIIHLPPYNKKAQHDRQSQSYCAADDISFEIPDFSITDIKVQKQKRA